MMTPRGTLHVDRVARLLGRAAPRRPAIRSRSCPSAGRPRAHRRSGNDASCRPVRPRRRCHDDAAGCMHGVLVDHDAPAAGCPRFSRIRPSSIALFRLRVVVLGVVLARALLLGVVNALRNLAALRERISSSSSSFSLPSRVRGTGLSDMSYPIVRPVQKNRRPVASVAPSISRRALRRQ